MNPPAPTSPPPPRGSLRRWLLLALALVVAIALGLGAWLVYRVVTVSLLAEENLHASRFAIRLVEEFVRTHRRWPRSWEELAGLKAQRGPFDHGYGMVGYVWPEDWPAALPRLRLRVVIDFDADPGRVARQETQEFSAVKPIGPYFEYRDYGEVDRLQSAIRRRIVGDSE
jgi:hypothetical protein